MRENPGKKKSKRDQSLSIKNTFRYACIQGKINLILSFDNHPQIEQVARDIKGKRQNRYTKKPKMG